MGIYVFIFLLFLSNESSAVGRFLSEENRDCSPSPMASGFCSIMEMICGWRVLSAHCRVAAAAVSLTYP